MENDKIINNRQPNLKRYHNPIENLQVKLESPKLRYLPSTPILESDYIRDKLRRKLDRKKKQQES